MASVEWIRLYDRPWPVPKFFVNARMLDRPWRDPFRRVAGLLRIVLHYVNGFLFRLFVWIADVHDVLTISDE